MTDHGMAHEEAREALEALALDALDSRESDAVLTHLAGCPACREELAALRATSAELAYAVRAEPMEVPSRDRVRSRLLARAAAERGHLAEDHAHAPDAHHVPPSFHIMVPHAASPENIIERQHWMSSPASWLAMAASVAAIVTGFELYQVSGERDTIRAAYRLATAERAETGVVDSLKAVVEDRDKLIANLTGPQVAVVTLAANSPQSPSARMFWDQSVNAWTFVAHNLPRPKAGRTYQLWLVTASQKISAGTFSPRANGDAVVRATYALPKDALAAVAVTDEPVEGSSQPTTTPLIVGMKSGR